MKQAARLAAATLEAASTQFPTEKAQKLLNQLYAKAADLIEEELQNATGTR